jgi:hypothetical protein
LRNQRANARRISPRGDAVDELLSSVAPNSAALADRIGQRRSDSGSRALMVIVCR